MKHVILQNGGELDGLAHFGQARASALAGSAQGLLRPCVGLLMIQTIARHRALREHGDDARHAELGGLLDHDEHSLPREHGAEQGDVRGRLGRARHPFVDEGFAAALLHHLQRGAKEMPVAVHDGEGFLFVDLPVAKRLHLKRVERDSFALGELGGMAERRVQGGRGHARSIGCFASQSTIATGP